jgi:hypothetical protein
MSPLSTSNSDQRGWRRFWREVGRLLILLLILELVLRVEPVKSVFSDALNPYENLLWYSEYMPAYREQLTNGPHYDVWMAGSSYMMTSLNPQWIQEEVETQGIEGLTFQNYGMTVMANLSDMAMMFDRWMFQMDQPRYLILGVAIHNFLNSAQQPSRARSSPMETTFIFPDSLDERISGWLYRNSALYHYALLSRNTTFIPRERTIPQEMPLGGFVESSNSFEGCDPTVWTPADTPSSQLTFTDFSALDQFIDVAQLRGIPLIVVNIPAQYCAIRNSFPNYADYKNSYLKAIAEYLLEKDVPFLELDSRFYQFVPQDEQIQYFRDYTHPNIEGARLFSSWTAEFAADWLQSLEQGDE